MFWIVRGLLGTLLIPSPNWMLVAKFAFYASVVGALTFFGGWSAFLLYWIVPYCTSHIAVQYTRLICEHSAVRLCRSRPVSARDAALCANGCNPQPLASNFPSVAVVRPPRRVGRLSVHKRKVCDLRGG
jgi:hypothetical protein